MKEIRPRLAGKTRFLTRPKRAARSSRSEIPGELFLSTDENDAIAILDEPPAAKGRVHGGLATGVDA